MNIIEGVRLASPKDEWRIFEILCLAHDENGMFPIDKNKVIEFIRNATQARGGIIGVIGKNEVEATIGLQLQQPWYTSKWILCEKWNFVHPDYRKTDHVSKLIEFSKNCAEKMELTLNIGTISNIRTEAKIRLYKRHFKLMGAFFSYNDR